MISAVGHETDVTIADFVADLRAPTPSAAAERVVAAREEFVARIDRLTERLRSGVERGVLVGRSRLHGFERRRAFAGVPAALAMRGRHVAELTQGLRHALRDRRSQSERRLALLGRRLDRHDPRKALADRRTRLTALAGGLHQAHERHLSRIVSRLTALVGRLDSLSPLSVLGRGYAVCWDASRTRVVRSASDVGPGDRVRVTLGEGEIDCRVTETSSS